MSKTLVEGEREFLFAPYSVGVLHHLDRITHHYCCNDVLCERKCFSIFIKITLTLTLTLIPDNPCDQVFQISSIKWSDVNANPHQIVFKAAIDNSVEDETLSLSPWF